MLGIEPGSFAKAVSSLQGWAISPAPNESNWNTAESILEPPLPSGTSSPVWRPLPLTVCLVQNSYSPSVYSFFFFNYTGHWAYSLWKLSKYPATELYSQKFSYFLFWDRILISYSNQLWSWYVARQALKFQSSCLHLLSAGITGKHHHIWLRTLSFKHTQVQARRQDSGESCSLMTFYSRSAPLLVLIPGFRFGLYFTVPSDFDCILRNCPPL